MKGNVQKNPQTLKHIDPIRVKVGLEEGKREKISQALSGLLASTYLLYLKTLYYHWNVTGQNFVGLHGLFEEQYQYLHQAGDELAERIRALGHFTPGTLAEFSKLSSVRDDEALPKSSEQMVQNLLKANELCSREAREVRELAENAEDEVTVDMMVSRMTYHDKTSWMLRAILE